MRTLKRYEELEDETGRVVRYRLLDGGGVVDSLRIARHAPEPP